MTTEDDGDEHLPGADQPEERGSGRAAAAGQVPNAGSGGA